MRKYEAQVKRGAAWLDTVSPKWEKKVKLENIDLAIYEGCVLGQSMGEEVSRIFCDKGKFRFSHGFQLASPNDKRSDYLNLSSAWAREIEVRTNK